MSQGIHPMIDPRALQFITTIGMTVLGVKYVGTFILMTIIYVQTQVLP